MTSTLHQIHTFNLHSHSFPADLCASVNCPSDACRDVGTCDPYTGACSTMNNSEDGTSCSVGGKSGICSAGSCDLCGNVTCPAGSCQDAGTCNPDTGLCSVPTSANDGTTCTGSFGSGTCTDGVCGKLQHACLIFAHLCYITLTGSQHSCCVVHTS